MVDTLQVGKAAPNFLTIGVYKKRFGKIRLSDYRGKKYVILIFYPANFTTLSPIELTAISDRIHEFTKLSTQVLGISTDSPFSHLKYLLLTRKEGGLENLKYPLISDITKTIVEDYQLLTNEGINLPGVFIIDKEGILQYITVNNLLCGRSVNELLRILKSIQYVKDNPGQVCPVDWKQGDQTLYSHPLKSKSYFKNLNFSNKT